MTTTDRALTAQEEAVLRHLLEWDDVPGAAAFRAQIDGTREERQPDVDSRGSE